MRLLFAVLLLSCTCVSAQTLPAANNTFDTVIIHGHIIDGTGSPWYSGQIGIRAGHIAAIGDLTAVPRQRTIDAHGRVVAPGFIDMLGQSELSILVDPRLPSKIFQGITTEITGEGNSVAPLNSTIVAADRTAYDHLKLTPLASAAAPFGGIYGTHMRSEGDGVLSSIDEAVQVGREAHIPVEIWHLKAAGKNNWGRMPEIIAHIEQARAQGVDISANTT